MTSIVNIIKECNENKLDDISSYLSDYDKGESCLLYTSLVFDAANRTAVKMIAKTWLKSAKIQDVGAYFAVSNAKSELSLWDSRLQVTSRGYMPVSYTHLQCGEITKGQRGRHRGGPLHRSARQRGGYDLCRRLVRCGHGL